MAFDPDFNKHDQVLDGPVVEYLGVQPARALGNQIVAVLSFRFVPATSFASRNISLTQAQVVRLRDDLNALLTTEGSWLFVERRK